MKLMALLAHCKSEPDLFWVAVDLVLAHLVCHNKITINSDSCIDVRLTATTTHRTTPNHQPLRESEKAGYLSVPSFQSDANGAGCVLSWRIVELSLNTELLD
eukprot:COSAG02_NODE_7268_length_3089_cov_85.224592_3_plen_102_part_00